MRPRSVTLVVDTAIMIAALLGRSQDALSEAARTFHLVTTRRAVEEARRRIELGLKRPDLLGGLDALLADIEVIPLDDLSPLLPAAEQTLREAVPSRNGSTHDAHVVALAWAADGDIWSADRDFAGTGVPSWSTPNLMRALV